MTQRISIPNDVKGLIFDLDGTILDSMPLHFKAYNHSLELWDVKYPKDIFFSRGGIPTKDTFEMIAKESNIEDFDTELALRRKRDYVDKNLDQVTLIDVVMDVVRKYHNKLPMTVGTGSNRATVTRMFEMFSLDRFFEHVVTATDVSKHKPHPETFLRCAELINIPPKDCIVFEDGKPGMIAAETAGMQVIDITQYT